MSNNAMTGFTPIWEGKVTDGSFQPVELLKQANKDMETKWKAAKPRPKYICKLKAQKESVALQFTDPTGERSRSPQGIGCKMTNNGVLKAVEKANLVTQAIQTESFNWDWFESTIQKKKLTTKEKEQLKEQKEKEEKDKPIGELFEAFKKWWFDDDKRSRNPRKDALRSWQNYYVWLDKTFLNEENFAKKLKNSLIVECVQNTQKDSSMRTRTLNSLRSFLEWCDKWDDYSKLIDKYKKENKPVKKERNIPSDKKIEHIFNTGFIPSKKGGNPRYHYRFPQWQFFYALLAVYGIRIHEAWNIANWDKSVTLDRGVWVEIEEYAISNKDTENENIEPKLIQLEEEITLPAVLDPNNKEKKIAIKHDTKTGYRVAHPLSPEGKDWFKQFGLNQPLNLPDVKNPLEYTGNHSSSYNCTGQATYWFKRKDYGFTPHDLRHAWNIRGHAQGKSPIALAYSLGHKLGTNTTTYLKPHIARKIETMDKAFGQTKQKQSEKEQLKEQLQQKDEQIKELEKENIQLKTAIERKDEEIERLRTELKMIKVIDR